MRIEIYSNNFFSIFADHSMVLKFEVRSNSIWLSVDSRTGVSAVSFCVILWFQQQRNESFRYLAYMQELANWMCGNYAYVVLYI